MQLVQVPFFFFSYFIFFLVHVLFFIFIFFLEVFYFFKFFLSLLLELESSIVVGPKCESSD